MLMIHCPVQEVRLTDKRNLLTDFFFVCNSFIYFLIIAGKLYEKFYLLISYNRN